MRTRLMVWGAAALVAVSTVAVVDAQRAGGPRRGGPGPDAVQPAPPPAPDAPPAEGRGPRGRGPGGPGGPAFRLDLTADQQKSVQSIVQKTRDEVAPLADELGLTRRNLHRELFADKRDAAKITALTTRVAQLEKQILDARVKSQTAIADLLTPDQKQRARTGPVFGDGPGPAGQGRMGGARGRLPGARRF